MVFHATVPAAEVGRTIDALGAAVCRPRFDAAQLEAEAQVVVEECKHYDDDPLANAGQELLELLYRGHPYGRPVLGTPAEVRAHRVEQVHAVHRRLFAGPSCLLVVAGEVDRDAVARQAEPWLRRLRPTRARPRPGAIPPVESPRIDIASLDVHEAYVGFAWQCPPLSKPDTVALEVGSVVLGYADGSRLHQHVRRHRGLAIEVYSALYPSRHGSAFVSALHTSADRVPEAAGALLDQTTKLAEVPIDADELSRAKAMLRSELVYRRETVQGMAHAVGQQLSLTGDLAAEERYFAALERVAPDDVQRACAEYLRPDLTCAKAIVPRSARSVARQLRDDLTLRLSPTPAVRRRGPKIRGEGRWDRLRRLPQRLSGPDRPRSFAADGGGVAVVAWRTARGAFARPRGQCPRGHAGDPRLCGDRRRNPSPVSWKGKPRPCRGSLDAIRKGCTSSALARTSFASSNARSKP